MVSAYDVDVNFREQLRVGISASTFHQLLRDLGDSSRHLDLIED
jgi:hypothetical protein